MKIFEIENELDDRTCLAVEILDYLGYQKVAKQVKAFSEQGYSVIDTPEFLMHRTFDDVQYERLWALYFDKRSDAVLFRLSIE